MKKNKNNPRKDMITYVFYVGGSVKIESSGINYLRELVQEIQEAQKGGDYSKHLADFLFNVEAAYQAYHELDQDNWNIVHDTTK